MVLICHPDAEGAYTLALLAPVLTRINPDNIYILNIPLGIHVDDNNVLNYKYTQFHLIDKDCPMIRRIEQHSDVTLRLLLANKAYLTLINNAFVLFCQFILIFNEPSGDAENPLTLVVDEFNKQYLRAIREKANLENTVDVVVKQTFDLASRLLRLAVFW